MVLKATLGIMVLCFGSLYSRALGRKLTSSLCLTSSFDSWMIPMQSWEMYCKYCHFFFLCIKKLTFLDCALLRGLLLDGRRRQLLEANWTFNLFELEYVLALKVKVQRKTHTRIQKYAEIYSYRYRTRERPTEKKRMRETLKRLMVNMLIANQRRQTRGTPKRLRNCLTCCIW